MQAQKTSTIALDSYNPNNYINQFLKVTIITFKFLTWWGQPAGIKTASPRFWTNVQGSIPVTNASRRWLLSRLMVIIRSNTITHDKLTIFLLEPSFVFQSQIKWLIMHRMKHLNYQTRGPNKHGEISWRGIDLSFKKYN